MPKLIFLAGSARKDSCNKKLAKAASEKAKELDADVTYLDLADYEAPIFCEDFEAENGMPESIQTLKKLFQEHDGFLIASPEYNGAFSPLLKNTLDWMSRPGPDKSNCFQGKVSAMMAASPGPHGGLRGLPQLRVLLNNIAMHGTHVIPAQFALGNAYDAFNDDGTLKNENPFFEETVKQFVETAEKLKKVED